ncbi:MAG: cell division protein FtsZ [Nanohaloarchaea archaeon SW_7_43_1]|nr:MAG: cell division protein FtsZ [Nanohaloarchaea archaeon SW_7_43_1]PSH01937.1 MAG: cell division protein FtsZ [Nanohaloarchaea archaeon SW_10_44_10]
MESLIDNNESGKDVENLDDVKDARIVVVGVGGAGNNQVTRIQKKDVQGADTVAINTDKQHLEMASANRKILVGKDLTKGLGAGGKPEKGARSAEENRAELRSIFKDADMVFLTAGMGGGTGTGATPVLAEIAKKEDCIVIGTVTMPFEIEGARMSKAEDGLYRLRQHVDTAIVIENDKLLDIAGDMPLDQAFGVADELITTMIKGVTETISKPSLVNLDYADVQAIMNQGGVAVVGYGESDTKNKGEEAIHEALSNPLLDVEFEGANGALLHVAGGSDLTLNEINDVGQKVKHHLDSHAQVIWGARVKEELQGKLQVISIITGVESPYVLGEVEEETETEVSGDVNDLGIEVIE